MSEEDWAPAAPTPLAEVIRPEAAAPATRVEVAGYSDLVEVARGGDSIVFRARQVSLDRDVAIKVVQPDGDADAARFERELQITVRLGRQHPHIVTVIDTTTTTTGQPCLVMEFHDLGSLHDRLRDTGPLPVSDVVAAGTAVVDALAFAHSHGVLHRDVKPQNVLVLPTSYVLSDFGIARMADAGHTATLERFSYRHASPQVLDGLPPTEADDLWSLGSTMFTLLDGRSPFASSDPEDDTALSYLRRVRLGQRRELARSDVPDELVAFIEACLEADRDARPASASEALARLRGIRTEDRSWQPDALGDVSGAPSAPEIGVHEPAAPAASPGPASAGAFEAPLTSATRGSAKPPTTAAAEPESEPMTVAPSVLAHVARERARTEEPEHTGLLAEQLAPGGPGGTGGTREPSEVAESDARPAGSPARRAMAFLGGAALVGVAIGAGALVIDRLSGPDVVTETPAPAVIPSGDVSVPPSTDIEVSNPALAPTDPVVVDNGTSVDVSWGAPQQAVSYYLVLQVADGAEPAVVSDLLPALVTQATVEGLDPDAQACFAILGLDADMTDRGVSREACRTPVP